MRRKLSAGAAAPLLAAVLSLTAASSAFAAGWAVDNAGAWYYTDSGGELLRAGVTPDGYLTDLMGRWDQTPYDGLVGTYTVVSDTLDGAEVTGEDVPGITRTLALKLMSGQHVSAEEIWAYPDGAVMRSSASEFFPDTGGTFLSVYYTERRGNALRWHDTADHSNATFFTDDGDGRITMTSDQDGKKRVTVYQKQ